MNSMNPMNSKISLGQLERNLDALVVMKVILAAIIMCVAESSLLIFITSMVLITLSLLLRLRDIALPRWLVNITCVMMVFILAVNILKDEGRQLEVLIAMGHFTLGLQVVQLYSRMTLREYNLVMTLGLLQVVAANIINVSLGIGVLTLLYAGLGLLCLLAYQMKRNRDAVDDANRGHLLDKKKIRSLLVDAQKNNGNLWTRIMIGRGYQSSLRTIIFCCFLVSVVIFVAIPRSGRYTQTQSFMIATTSVSGSGNNSPERAAVGYNDQVNLRKPSPVDNADAAITLTVKIKKDGQVLDDSNINLLRGAALDAYGTRTGSWEASDRLSRKMLPVYRDIQQGVQLEPAWPGEDFLDVEVNIRNARSSRLFSLGVPRQIQSDVIPAVRYNRLDQSLKTLKRLSGPISYKLKVKDYREDIPNVVAIPRYYASEWPLDQSENFLRFKQLGLSVIAKRGLIELPSDAYDNLDKTEKIDINQLLSGLEQKVIAETLSAYLTGPEFEYSLDNPKPDDGHDPVAQFLFEWRKGHCELFAAAHAAMCRALGIRARVVVGYRLSEYNQLMQYFVVRPGHAHSWTEVLCNDYWVTFDPTPGSAVDQAHESIKPKLVLLSHVMDMINASWIRNVMAFDTESRMELITFLGLDVESRKQYLAIFKQWMQKLVLMIDKRKFEAFVYLGLMLVVMIWILSSLLMLWRARKRFKLLNFKGVGKVRRRQLRKDLTFYFRFLELIRRYGFKRHPWQSHKQFLDGLMHSKDNRFASSEVKQILVTLNEAFYKIRFGGSRPSIDEARQFTDAVRELKRILKAT